MSRAYVLVLAAAALCYAALGAVLRILPGHVGGDLGGARRPSAWLVGAPALTAVVARPRGRPAGRIARGPAPVLVIGGALVMSGRGRSRPCVVRQRWRCWTCRACSSGSARAR